MKAIGANPPVAAMPDWLRRRGEGSPHHLALVAPAGRWTFAQLDAAVDRVVGQLAALSVGRDQRIGVLLANDASFAILTHALGRVGAVMVPCNSRLTTAELAWQAEDSLIHRLIYDFRHIGQAAALAAALPGLPRLAAGEERLPGDPYLGLGAANPGDRRHRLGASRPDVPDPAATPAPSPLGRQVDLGAVHTIMYTSGTTGRPKGAQLTYGNHWWSAIGSALNLGLHHDDRWLACLPLFHVGGLSILMRSVIYGITTVIHDGFDAARVNRAIADEGITIVSVVAAMLQRLLAAQGSRPYPTHLRCILVGGGPVPEPLLADCARRGLPVVQTYGLTETASQVATLPPGAALDKLGAAGKPLLPNEIKVVDSNGGVLPVGAVGEILVRGPSVTPGYFRQPAATAAALAGGWLHTGDLGAIDAEGYLYVSDRRDDLIISGGENIYPSEVEAVLMSHPAVAAAGVVGIEHERWGRVPAAAVRLHPGAALTAAALQDYCGRHLARYKVPAQIRMVSDLPRNAAGKLVRRRLVNLFTVGS